MSCTVPKHIQRRKNNEKITKNDSKRNETSTSKKPNIKIIFIKKFYGIKFLLCDEYGTSEGERDRERHRAVV